MIFFTDVVQAISEPLAASRPKFFLRSNLLLRHTWDTTQTSNTVPTGWAPATKTERHKRKIMYIFEEEERNQEKTFPHDNKKKNIIV